MDQNEVELESHGTHDPDPHPHPNPNPFEQPVEEKPSDEEMTVGEGEMESSQLHDPSPEEASIMEPEAEPSLEPEPEPEPEPELEPEPEPAVVPVKRKRGRPPKSQTLKVAAKKEAAKKVEEDVCFICFDGGNLVVCDRRGCPKVYHPVCVNRDEAFFQTSGRWNCGWHICSICEKAAHYMCYTCTYSLCKACIKESGFVCVRGMKGFCETCYDTVLQIESKGDSNQANVGEDFDDSNTFECLFKYYWFYMKEKLSLTLEELKNTRSPWKRSGASARKEESSDESYNVNDDQGDSSDCSSGVREGTSSKKKGRKRSRAITAEVTAVQVDNGGAFVTEGTEWASKEILEFVTHMKGGDRSFVSQFDVQSLLLEYIKQNNLRDPRRKSQIICDPRLENLFGKARVGHFEMLKLLESHFLIKESTQVVTDDNRGGLLDPDFGPTDAEGYNDGATKLSYDKRRKTRKKVEEREPQTNLDDYAAIDVHNISLIYLRRNLLEDLLDDVDKFNEKVVGCFVRIRISGMGQKQDLYRLVQIAGISKAAEKYKTGRKTTDFTLEILNLDKTEVVTIDTISNQDFTEEECKRLRQSVKCGLISRLTVGDVQEKSRSLQDVRVNDWLESEKLRLSHLRDRASETGRRKELRECVEKLQLLNTPEERRRRLNEVPEIHADPNMDPDYESAEEVDTDDKSLVNSSRARELSLRKGREAISPRGRVPASNNWAGARKGSNSGRELSKNTKFEGARDTWETARSQPAASEPVVWSNSQLAKETGQSCSAIPESTTTFSPSDTTETEKIWYYNDPAGKIQGPFCVIQLRKWSSSGFFPKDMRIWQASEKEESSILLTDALNGKFDNDLPPWEPPQNHCQHPPALVAGTDNKANKQEGAWRENNNTSLLDIHQNRDILTGTVNTALPNATWSARTMDWSGPSQAHSNSRLIAPFLDNPQGPLSCQNNGDHGGGNTQSQDLGRNWIPGGQHSNWSSVTQPPSRNHGGNDLYNPPTTLLQSNVDRTNAQVFLNSPPSPTPVQPMGAEWGAARHSIQRVGAMVLGGSTHTEFIVGVSNNQFENECPSPTPRSERQEITSVQCEPHDNMSPIKDKEIKMNYPASSTMLPHESNGLELLPNRILEGWSPTSTNCPNFSPGNSGHRWEQNQTTKQQSSIQRPEPLKVEGPARMVKGEEWSLPSPTPSLKPSGWNVSPDFATGHGQNNQQCTSEREQRSQIGFPTGAVDAPSSSWGAAPQTGSMGAGPAQGEANTVWSTSVQGSTNTGMESVPRGNLNMTWGTSAQGNTGWATSSAREHMVANKGYGVPQPEIPNPNMGWGMPVQLNANPNAGWGTLSQAQPNLHTGWGPPSHAHANPNASWAAKQESVKTNPGWPTAVSWGTGLQDATDGGSGTRHYRHEDRYRSGVDHDPKYDSRHGGDSRYDSRYDGWRSQRDNRMHSDRGWGPSGQSPRGGGGGQVQGGPTGICKFHEGGYCKKGASCKYRHL